MCMCPQKIQVPKTNLGIFNETQRFLTVPCGKCEECRVSHAKQWAVRCMCEYESRSDIEKSRCWFITFTYDDIHNPGSLRSRDMTLMFKRLRKRFKDFKIKYFYCGEYGSRTYRPHYHAIIYNLPLNDLVKYKENFAGDMLFISPELTEIWGNGYVVVGALTLQSANYTARYALKKNETDCFIRVSHGFGKDYFFKNLDDIISNGFITVASNKSIVKASIPKYFLKLYRKYLNDDDQYSDFIKFRMRKREKYMKFLDVLFKSKYSWEKDKIFKTLAKQIDMSGKALEFNSRAKRIINQSLYDLYQNRDF